MKLFNRAKEEEEAEFEEDELASAESMEAPEEAGPDPSEELAAVLDASVKEISEKIARLSSSVESSQEARTGLEEKLLRMEDRMRKLSSLTEMISSQYNPFLGDGQMEGEGASAAAAGAESLPPPAFPTLETGMPPAPAAAKAAAAMEAPAAMEEALPEFPLDEPDAPHDADLDAAEEEDFDFLAAEEADDGPEALHEAPPAPEAEAAADDGARLDRVRPSFENSMLMLKWADTLLHAAKSREGVEELLNYYETIGWIGDGVRTQLLAYAGGLSVPESDTPGDWRASADIHERTLLFIEKLRGCRKR